MVPSTTVCNMDRRRSRRRRKRRKNNIAQENKRCQKCRGLKIDKWQVRGGQRKGANERNQE
jgi:hypothetical protein